MVGPYTGGPPPMNGNGYQQSREQQRYDSGMQPYNQQAMGMNARNIPAGYHAPERQMSSESYHSQGRGDPRQQHPGAGYQLRDPQLRDLPPAPQQEYGGRPQVMTRPSEDRQLANVKSQTNGQRRPSGSRICGKCGEPLQGQFVRALDNTFHLDCFTCHVRIHYL